MFGSFGAPATSVFGGSQKPVFGNSAMQFGSGLPATPAGAPFGTVASNTPTTNTMPFGERPATPAFSFAPSTRPDTPAQTTTVSFAPSPRPATPARTTTISFAPSTNDNSPAPAPLVIEGVTATPSPVDLAERRSQEPMFTGVVLRDAYRFLCDPDLLGDGARPPKQHLAAAMLGKPSGTAAGLDTFAFVDRAALPASSLPDGWQLLDDTTLLSALNHLGEATLLPIAATRAFEKYLQRKALHWSDEHTRRFSVEFLVAFGRELTPRLDVSHRIRSTKLTVEEYNALSGPPFSLGVDQGVLHRFQAGARPAPPAPHGAAPPVVRLLPAPSGPELQGQARPETPVGALPPLPLAAGAGTKTNAGDDLPVSQLLFTKV